MLQIINLKTTFDPQVQITTNFTTEVFIILINLLIWDKIKDIFHTFWMWNSSYNTTYISSLIGKYNFQMQVQV